MDKIRIKAALISHKNALFILYLSLLALFTLKRITLGIDLSDESYYATFLDEWLKEGIPNAQNRMLHQTAEFLLFPWAYLYKLAMGSETGLILFLRSIYVVIAFSSMLTFYYLVKRIQGQTIAALVFGCGFLFIPWSLPAPSYNTLGMFGLLGGMSLFASSILNIREHQNFKLILLVSALSWTAAIVAYPTLLLVFCVFISLSYFALIKERYYIVHYFLFCTICLFLAGLTFLYTFGVERLLNMFEFSNSNLNVSTGLWGKLAKAKGQVLQDKVFLSLCALFFLSGITLGMNQGKKYLGLILGVFLGSALIYVGFFKKPILFLASHDIILLLAALGVFIPCKTMRHNSSNNYFPLINILYCSSLLAGSITTITATNALYNFPIGGLLAAVSALAFFSIPDSATDIKDKNLNRINVILLAIVCITMGSISYRFIYGEIYGKPFWGPKVKIKEGVFSGLWTSPPQALLIHKITELLQDEQQNKKIIALGRLPGIYLLTMQSPMALTTWNYNSVGASDLIHQFYVENDNQPTMIIRFIDQWSLPLTQAEDLLIATYAQKKEYPTEYGTFIVYEKVRGA